MVAGGPSRRKGMEWADPPKARRPYKKARYMDSLKVLMTNPKKWGKIDTFDNPSQANSARTNLKWAIRLKKYKFPEGHAEFQWSFSVQKDPEKIEWGLYCRTWPINERLPE
jgi:hypothetical protein